VAGPATIVGPTRGRLQPLAHDAVELRSGFWGDRQERNGSATLPHVWRWITRLGWIDNFAVAAGERPADDRRGREFTDSFVYNALEASSWHTARVPGAPRGEAADVASAVARAQQADGYVNTWFGRPEGPPRYGDLEWGHELYCLGHLIQAGIADLRGGGGAVFAVAQRAADHVEQTFRDGANDGVCGHPEIEMALVEMFRATGAERYLAQAQRFIARRGHGRLRADRFGAAYFQDDVPVLQASVLRGHAVRALYLAAGVVDVAVETDERELLEAVAAQLETTLARRTHLTGGMGSRHHDEAFGDDFELPPDRAYCESCAGIATVMLSWRLLLATGEVRYGDLFERALYNIVASCADRDGTAFFYANTLHQRTAGAAEAGGPDEPNPRAADSTRSPWFTVSCCPANLVRTLAALHMYVATTDAGGIQLHQYAACTIDDGLRELAVETRYPDDGEVTVRVVRTPPEPWTLTLRIPEWARTARLELDGRVEDAAPGYALCERRWAPGDQVRLLLDLEPRWTFPDDRIDALRGTVALERGPRVYCLESLAGGPDLDEVAVDPMSEPTFAAGDGVTALTTAGCLLATPPASWPYGRRLPRTVERRLALEFVPYHDRGNRGPSTMRVFVPRVPKGASPDDG
jgi:DUF1680 family protein